MSDAKTNFKFTNVYENLNTVTYEMSHLQNVAFIVDLLWKGHKRPMVYPIKDLLGFKLTCALTLNKHIHGTDHE